MKNRSIVNRGEGNPEAAERFNKAESEFVASERGKERIRADITVPLAKQAELDEAERSGKARARGEAADGPEG